MTPVSLSPSPPPFVSAHNCRKAGRKEGPRASPSLSLLLFQINGFADSRLAMVFGGGEELISRLTVPMVAPE